MTHPCNITTPILTIERLRVTFAGHEQQPAVQNATLHINPAETVALVGESGSGKSVTVLSILQLLPPSARYAGAIHWKGQSLIGAPARELQAIRGNRISMIFQEPMTSLNPLHRIEQQISEALLWHQRISVAAARERTLELLTLVGIKNAASRLQAYPHELSGGERQRVMIAMALAHQPDLLIADEPTTALDVTVQAKILQLLKDLQAQLQMALLLITHDLNLVRRIADRVCVMQAGEIVETAPTAQLFTRPQHPYTQKLLAAEPQGEAPSADAQAPVIMQCEQLTVCVRDKSLNKDQARRWWWQPAAKKVIVNQVNFQVQAGHTVGIVGESGSGKTTLALALLRLLPSTGKIVFLGQGLHGLNESQLRPLRQGLQVVFQDPASSLSPRLSVAQIIAEGLQVHQPRLSAAQREIQIIELLEKVGLDPAIRHRYAHEFSGGQRQRIAIARAMILKPRLVILDEPTSALDRTIQADILSLLKQLQQQAQLSYILISHDLKVIRALSHELYVMHGGQVVEFGPTAQLIAQPQQPYTQALLAASGLA